MGDVIRDLPEALADAEWEPTVITPAYGIFGQLPGARLTGSLDVNFAGARRNVEIFSVPGTDTRIRHLAFEHPLFSPAGTGKIYCDDGHDRPFATDASKFALFSAAAAAYASREAGTNDIVHLHDWHTALYLVLRRFDERFRNLADIRTVFTIHNLAMQGVRPLAGDPSSLQAWFPELAYDAAMLVDPRWGDCINPMAAAIRLADGVSTVSPTYAMEVQQPDDPEHGFHGGEGLEQDLQRAAAEGRLVGILNGCMYPKLNRRRPGWRRLLDTIRIEVEHWRQGADTGGPLHDLALERLGSLPKRRPGSVLTSIGRLTPQKVDLFLTEIGEGRTALDAVLDDLGREGMLILLGSGDAKLEQRMFDIAGRHGNFLFLCGYSQDFTDLLYRAGDLFLMPSSFEPCGISQMLAMRAGQPCVVHAVGGLRDTVRDSVNGFSFAGATREEQASNFVTRVRDAIDMKTKDTDRWLRTRSAALAARFSWKAAAGDYINRLYL